MAKLRRTGQSREPDKIHNFDIDTLQYPMNPNIHDNGHTVVFFINVPGHSKLGESLKDESDYYTPTVDHRGSIATTKTVKTVVKSGSIDAGPLGKIDIAPGRKQLKSAISLYMPNSFSETYSAMYEKGDTGRLLNLFADSFASGQSMGEGSKAFTGGLMNMAATGAISGLMDAVGADAAKTTIQGKIENTNSEQIFKGMDFRNFSMDFLMAPKSKEESQNVYNIIEMFRYHMHPERSEGQYLILPAEFEIEFYSGGDVNQFIGGISTCALTGLTVDYTPNDIWSAFKDSNGYPTSVRLRLQFQELEPLTKDRLQDFKESPYGHIQHIVRDYVPKQNDPKSVKSNNTDSGSSMGQEMVGAFPINSDQ